jgi:hypothetical protein
MRLAIAAQGRSPGCARSSPVRAPLRPARDSGPSSVRPGQSSRTISGALLSKETGAGALVEFVAPALNETKGSWSL